MTWLNSAVNAFPLGVIPNTLEMLLLEAILDASELSNYSPVSNIPVMGKGSGMCGGLVAPAISRGTSYLDPFQSSIRPVYGIEAALVDYFRRDLDRSIY